MATGQYNSFPIDWKSLDASQVPYSNISSGLTATDVQGAIDELNTDLNAIDASDVPYDNTASGMTADDVQEALDELASEKQDTLTAGDGITISSDTISADMDDTLTSAVKPAQAKAVGDALSAQETATEEALYTKAPVIVDSATGSIASFPDGADGYPLKECVVDVDAVQDLHGYDNPWPAGGGKNILPNNLTTTTYQGVTVTKNDDGTYTLKNTNSGSIFDLYFNSPSGIATNATQVAIPIGSYKFSGITGGSNSTYRLYVAVYEEGQSPVYVGTNDGDGSFTVASGQKIAMFLRVYAGQSFSNMKVYPMIRESTADNTFAPYSNECPISGWSSAKVTRTGKNMLNASATEIGTAWNGTSNSARARLVIPLKRNTQYTLTMNGTNALDGVYSSLSTVVPPQSINYRTFPYSFDSGVNDYLVLGFNKTAISQADIDVLNLQLEFGSTATDYEPYHGNTYTIPLGDTRYGGTLDVTRGKLKVTHAYKVLDGSENWYAITSPANGFRNSGSTDFPGRKSGGEFICNRLYDKGNSLSDLTNTWDAVFASNLNIRTDNLFADADAFKTWLASNNLQCVYELDTPIEVDLTPTEITTLLGTNNIFADTGDVEVEYCCSTRLFIEKKLAELA